MFFSRQLTAELSGGRYVGSDMARERKCSGVPLNVNRSYRWIFDLDTS